ncbi:MAG: DNA-3-methyladenine glycosylase I [Rhizobiaceae bacterium]
MNEKKNGLIEGPDGALRCAWHGNDDFYRDYHDHEWGRPVAEDQRLFEKVCLEGFQSGLSWITILRKRENFREAFDGFRFERIAYFTDKDVQRLLGNAGIVRHRGKIESVINNARRAKELVDEAGSLGAFFWRFEPQPKERPRRIDHPTLLANTTSPASINLSRELKKRGWSFVGPTTIYAFMQAMGLVNDHLEGCVCRQVCELERRQFRRPG